MLKQIEIENFVFFKNITLELHEGFNVFTGETGTGKTIFLNALGLTLGNKIVPNSIRTGEKHIRVTSTFDISNHSVLKQSLSELGYEIDNELLLQRDVNQGGKSKVRINGELTSLDQLKSLASQLIDIHSQNDNQTLLTPNTHLSLLDQFADLEATELADYQKHYRVNQVQRQELQSIIQQEKQLQEEKDFLEFTLKDLKDVIDEEKYESLKQDLKHTEEQQKTSEIFFEIDQLLRQQITPILDQLEHLTKKLHFIKTESSDQEIEKNDDVTTKVKQLSIDIEAIFNPLFNQNNTKDYSQQIDHLNKLLAATESKLKKYGIPVSQLFEKLNKTKEKLEFLDTVKVEKSELEAKIKKSNLVVFKKALDLHETRKRMQSQLEDKITQELKYLGMKNSTLSIRLTPEIALDLPPKKQEELLNNLTSRGFSKAEFYYSPAQEVSAKPLKKIASGGELSRIMLAIKSIFSEKLPSETIIFDEIDIGVGGQTAINIGKKIQTIGTKKQVLVITHLPQIAKYANRHFKLEKSLDSSGLTFSDITTLSQKDRYQEFSRMLGNKDSGENLELVKKYLDED